ncbi:MAG: DUF1320 family protein [Fervidobacterium sp.]|nr:DUF1320 family protein [Fervidobacterium sp.]
MSYLTVSEFKERFGVQRVAEIVSDDNLIQTAIDDATAEIDSYLAVRYVLPLPIVPAVIKRLCADIAMYRLLTLRDMGEIEDVRKRYEDAVKLLQEIAKGNVSLGVPQASQDKPATSYSAAQVSDVSVFKRGEFPW